MENASQAQDTGFLWKAIGLIAALIAGFLVQKLVEGAWQAASGHKPPAPDDPDSDASIREVALAAALTGAAGAVARGLAQRGTQRMALRAAGTV